MGFINRLRATRKPVRQVTEILIASRDLQQIYIELGEIQNYLKKKIRENKMNVNTCNEDLELIIALDSVQSIEHKLDMIIIKAS